MPLPWLIGAAVAAAAAVVVKAINDDDSSSSSSSSSDSGDSERRMQEREARLQRKRDGLASKADGLKKDRLIEARDLLVSAVKTLSLSPKQADVLSTSDFDSALASKLQSQSAYAQGFVEILTTPSHSSNDFSEKEHRKFLVNLQVLEGLTGPFSFSGEEQRNLSSLREIGSRLDRLQHLKQLLEQ